VHLLRKDAWRTVEHFPPKDWGGFDHPHLMFSGCTPCNSSWGRWLANQPKPRLRPPGTLHLAHAKVGVTRLASAALDVAHQRYLYGKRTGDIADLDRAGSP